MCIAKDSCHTFFEENPNYPLGCWDSCLDSELFFFSSGFRGFNAEQNDGRAHILHEIFVNKKLPEDLWEVRFFCWNWCCFQIDAELLIAFAEFYHFLIACKYHFNGVSYVFFIGLGRKYALFFTRRSWTSWRISGKRAVKLVSTLVSPRQVDGCLLWQVGLRMFKRHFLLFVAWSCWLFPWSVMVFGKVYGKTGKSKLCQYGSIGARCQMSSWNVKVNATLVCDRKA